MSVLRRESDFGIKPGKTGLSSQLLHDLRSSLNQIIGFAEMLNEESEGPTNAKIGRDLEKIGAAGRRMLTLIEENFTAVPGGTGPVEVMEEERDSEQETGSASHQLAAIPGLMLVVDDDATNREVLSRRLMRLGHRVITAVSGREALKLLRGRPFDLVLLDIMMPDMDGYEVLRQIKADVHLQHVPVVMISALNEVQSVVRCIEAGAEDYLAKPFTPTLLQARIGASLEKKRGRDREAALFEQLQENYKLLQEVEKLRDDMRNMIVHDLRTPLTSVIMGVEMLEKHGELNEPQREMMAIATTGGRTLLGMINDLLDVEKMESGSAQLQKELLSAAELVAGAVEQVASLAENGQTVLRTEIGARLPLFPGDENLLSRTLVNLIANAVKFTDGGSVTITATQDQNENIRFAVRDTGEGISSEAFDRIFEKFGQLDSSKVGTGLGLAFCKLAVEAHGGQINVESTPGVGSTFSFTIPLGLRPWPPR